MKFQGSTHTESDLSLTPIAGERPARVRDCEKNGTRSITAAVLLIVALRQRYLENRASYGAGNSIFFHRPVSAGAKLLTAVMLTAFLAGAQTTLPTGWRLNPAGQQIALDDFPMSSLLSRDGKSLFVDRAQQQ